MILAMGDMHQPSNKVRLAYAQEEEIPDDVDYTIAGNNRLDEIVEEKFCNLDGFVVNEATVNRMGDLCLHFANGFALELTVDVSGGEECWRFFQSAGDTHMIVTGQELVVGVEE